MRSRHELRSDARAGAGKRAGFSLLDITIAMTVMTVGFGAVIYAMVGAMSLSRFAQERSAALAAAESALEALQGETFSEVFARFNATPGDDPPLGASPGPNFPAPGLSPVPGDPDGMPGQIEFPGNGVLLSEGVVDADLGMPRDLDGDGLQNGTFATGYIVLPVRVRVSWNGTRGNSQLVLVTTLNNERKGP